MNKWFNRREEIWDLFEEAEEKGNESDLAYWAGFYDGLLKPPGVSPTNRALDKEAYDRGFEDGQGELKEL